MSINTIKTMSEITLKIEGMHCGACVRRVIQALERTPGTEVVEVSIGAARIKTDDAAQVVASVAKAGYAAQPE
jgi:copper chaperone CopZ